MIHGHPRSFAHAFATQDWHPPGHLSFASAHPGKSPFDTIEMPYGEQTLWPDHALQGTAEAEIHHGIHSGKIEAVVRKGFRKSVDSYSAFFENDHATRTGLDGYLKARGFTRVFLAGLATDFCVGYSAGDAAALGYSVFVIEDACCGIGIPLGDGRTTIDAMRERLSAKGVHFIRSSELATG